MRLSKTFDHLKAFVPIVLCCVIITFGIYSRPDIVAQFINSDSLQPAHMAWDMTQHSYAVANFQWSRVPSLLDLIFFFTMHWASVGWRMTFLLYTCLVAVGTILSLGWVVARMRGSAYREGVFWAGIGVTVAFLTLMAGAIQTPKEASFWVPQALLFYCNFHGNAFILSVVASCTALGAIRGNRRQAWITWVVCAVGMFSDTIFPGNFLVPFVLAGLILAWRHRGAEAAPTYRSVLVFAAKASLACAVGWAAKLPLFIQKMQLLSPGVRKSLGLFVEDLPRAPWIVFLLALTMALSVAVLWRLRPTAEKSVPTATRIDREWLALTGLGASIGTFGLMLLVLYAEPDAVRYALPFLWWPVTIALGLLPLPTGRHGTAVTAATAGAAVLAVVALPLATPIVLHWRTPLEQCLTAHRSEWGLKAGLSPYWQSRETMASSDWKFQVDQVDENGYAYIWGNNFAAYTHDMTAPERPPVYNFVLANEKIDMVLLEVFFGAPVRHEICAGYDVLIYDVPVKPTIADRPDSTLEFQFDPIPN
jgi:hypothetical protein